MAISDEHLTGEVTHLLQQLIRNRCVNDGSPDSGGESRSADTLQAYLDGCGLDIERYEPRPGRGSLMTRIDGVDPNAPTLLLMGHTDVVPADGSGWRRDPFGGELVDGEVWGRGAVDMLDLTASMAVAVRHLALDGFRPRGTLVFLAVADEEALGSYGAGWLVDHAPDAVHADYVLTELGGARVALPTPEPRIVVAVAEKGPFWCTLTVRGAPGHGSMPFGADNSLVKAGRVITRLAEHAPPAGIVGPWWRFVEGLGLPAELTAALVDPAAVDELIAAYPDPALARFVHACTHTSVAPTMLRGGVKNNVIPDRAEITVDIRALPGMDEGDVRRLLAEAVGDLWDDVEVTFDTRSEPGSVSPVDTPLWDVLARSIETLQPGCRTVPFMLPATTDARLFRRTGATAYGAGLLSERIPLDELISMFHGDNERVDQRSLLLSARLWAMVSRSFLEG